MSAPNPSTPRRVALKTKCETCGSSDPCRMCRGTGRYRYVTADYKRGWADCLVCWGTGIDHV